MKIESGSGLAGTNLKFVTEDDSGTASIILSVEGEAKTGRTRFSLTAPKKLAYYGVDFGFDRADRKIRLNPLIARAEYPYDLPKGTSDPDKIAAHVKKVAWQPFKDDFLKAVDSGMFRTHVWDTATEFWELLRLADFGRTSNVIQREYGPANAEYKSLVRAVKQAGQNLILIHQVRDKWNTTPPVKERHGMSKIDYLVDSFVSTHWNPKAKPGEPRWTLKVIRCGHRPAMNGKEFHDEDINFESVVTQLKPEVDADAWGY